jgi:UDP-3-O-[3-hydroxymyristoyl] N-acetylglucosamine deacetylase
LGGREPFYYTGPMAGRELLSETAPFSGRGLHSGRHARMVIAPSPVGSGICFVRSDLRPPRIIPVSLWASRPGPRCTMLSSGEATVSTVEHVLSALNALGIGDAEIVLAGAEVPAVDGSAAPFMEALLKVSRPIRDARPTWRVMRPLAHAARGGSCQLLPRAGSTVECSVDFPHPVVGRQWVRLDLERPELYRTRFAAARTFGFFAEAGALRRARFARGATLGNTLVFDDKTILNPGGTRFPDAPVRHKVVDAVGDLALLGGPLLGLIKLRRCSHALIIATLRRALAEGAIVQGGRA